MVNILNDHLLLLDLFVFLEYQYLLVRYFILHH